MAEENITKLLTLWNFGSGSVSVMQATVKPSAGECD